MKTHYPYAVVFGDVKSTVTELAVDDTPLPDQIDKDGRVVELRGIGHESSLGDIELIGKKAPERSLHLGTKIAPLAPGNQRPRLPEALLGHSPGSASPRVRQVSLQSVPVQPESQGTEQSHHWQ